MNYMILSVDTGIDDALAIAYALGQKEYRLLGITVSYGMAPLEKTYRNTRHLLNLLGHPEVPVYPGSTAPLQGIRTYNGDFHGMDGAANLLGEPSWEEKPPEHIKSSVTFIKESIEQYGRDLTLVTTGPLTDLARLLNMHPLQCRAMGQIISMGGALTCPGNSSPVAEANIKADVTASKAVLEAGLPLTLIGLDVTRKTLLTLDEIQTWRNLCSEAGFFYCNLLTFYLNEYRRFYPYLKGCALHDPLAVAAACNPQIFTMLPFHLTVCTDGPLTGRITENLMADHERTRETMVALKVDSQAFKSRFLDMMRCVLEGFT